MPEGAIEASIRGVVWIAIHGAQQPGNIGQGRIEVEIPQGRIARQPIDHDEANG